MEIKEAQVIEYLHKKKTNLIVQLRRIDAALKALGEVGELNELDTIAEIYSPYELIDNDDYNKTVLMYNPRMTAKKKVEFVLGKLVSADASEIAEYIMRIDRSIKDRNKLHERITYVCSQMYREGTLTADRMGKKYVYRLK